MTDATAFSDITNPYGLLRSPWNTNPVPFLMRANRTFFGYADGYSSFPTCSAFKTTLDLQSMPDTLYKLNGQLHGPVHLMVKSPLFVHSSAMRAVAMQWLRNARLSFVANSL
jgi:hypothetical protein